MWGLWTSLRRVLVGYRLDAALARHRQAADELDRALREVVKR